MLQMNQLIGFGAGGIGGPSLSFTANAQLTNQNNTNVVFTSQNIGDAVATRRVIVAIAFNNSGAGSRTLDSATIGGVAATVHVQSNDSAADLGAAIISATVASGTTANVDLTFSGNMEDVQIGVFRAVDLASGTPHNTASDQTDPINMTLDIPEGGFAIGVGINVISTTAFATSGLTELLDQALGTSDRIVIASESNLGAQTARPIDFDGATGGAVGVCASWS